MSAGADGGTATPGTTSGQTDDEVARLRAERDDAVAALYAQQHRAQRRGWFRQAVAGVLVFLFAVLLPLTVASAWVRDTILDTENFVDTVTPIATDPAVTDAVSREVTDQLYTALDPQQIIADALPPEAAFLAGPIADGARGSVEDAVNQVLSSEEFQQLWVAANERSHATLVAVLRGDSEVVQATDGQVVLNLVPVLNGALTNVEDFASGVVGTPVDLPAIGSDELPSAACERISAALNRPLPDTCGQIALFPAENLEQAQQGVQIFEDAVVVLLVLTPLIAIGALAVSRRRRRTLLQLTIGGALGLVILRRLLMWQQDSLVSTGRPENEDARRAIVSGVLDGFFDLTAWLLVAALVIAVVALVTGPYEWAVRTRKAVSTAAWKGALLVSAALGRASAQTSDDETVRWVRRHVDALRIGGVVVALLLLLLVDVNVWRFLLIGGLLALYEAGLQQFREPDVVVLPEGEAEPSAEGRVATVPAARSERDVEQDAR